MSKLTKVFIVIGVLYFVVAAYFIVVPLYFKYPSQVLVHELCDLSSARNYYTVISSISSTVTGFLGLLLGYIYFDRKNILDEQLKKREQSRNRLQFVINELSKYDEQVDEIISLRISKDEELSRCRSKIQRYFENVQVLLEHNELLLGLKDDDLNIIMMVNSYVEQSKEIMELDFDKLQNMNMSEIRATHIDNMQEAKKICYLRMV